jgi:putative DNA primase/helicase
VIVVESMFFRKPFPLYNTYAISRAKSQTIIIVESELDLVPIDKLGNGTGYIVTTWPGKEYTVDEADWLALDNLNILFSLEKDCNKSCSLAFKVYEAVRRDCRSLKFNFLVPTSLAEAVDGSFNDGPLPGTKILDLKNFQACAYKKHGLRLGDELNFCQSLASYTCKELNEMTIELRPDILTGFLPNPGSLLVYGPRGCGKTWFVIKLAKIIATGSKDGFDGRISAPEKVFVLYIDGEMLLEKIKYRISILEMAKLENIRWVFKNEQSIPDLSTPEGQNVINTHIKSLGLSTDTRLVIVIDNLASLAPATLKNDPSSWHSMNEWFLDLKRKGISIIFVHHSGKDGDQLGSSTKENGADTVIRLNKSKGSGPGNLSLDVNFTKYRYYQGPGPLSFCANLVFSEDGASAHWETYDRSASDGIDSLDRKKDAFDTERALDLAQQGLTEEGAAKEFGFSRSTFRRQLEKCGVLDEFTKLRSEARSKIKAASSDSKKSSKGQKKRRNNGPDGSLDEGGPTLPIPEMADETEYRQTEEATFSNKNPEPSI